MPAQFYGNVRGRDIAPVASSAFTDDSNYGSTYMEIIRIPAGQLTAPTLAILWEASAADSASGHAVRFRIGYKYFAVGDVMDVSGVQDPTDSSLTDASFTSGASPFTASKIVKELPVTLSFGADKFLFIALGRDGAHSADTYTGDVKLLGVDLGL